MINKYPQLFNIKVNVSQEWGTSDIFNYNNFLCSLSEPKKISIVVLDTDKAIMESGFEHLFNSNGSFMFTLLKSDLKKYDNVIFDEVLKVLEQAKYIYDLKKAYKSDDYENKFNELKDRYKTIRPYFLINAEDIVEYSKCLN